jgi:hypothetical protein
MSTLDEIIKEKQRLGEALARVDAQRDKLTSQLNELEAAERVLARYSKGTQTKKTLSGKTPTMATQAAAPARQSTHRRTTIAKPAGVRRSSPSLNDQVLALAIGKTKQEITAACQLRPAVFGIAIVAALDRRAWTSLDPHQPVDIGGLDHLSSPWVNGR